MFWIFSAENRQQAASALTSELASLCASQRRPIAIHQLACLKAGGETLCDFASSLARLIQFSVPSKTLCALHLYWARGGNNQPAIRVYSPLKRQCPNWYYVCFIFIFNLYSTHLKALGESDESCNTFRCKYFFFILTKSLEWDWGSCTFIFSPTNPQMYWKSKYGRF